MNDKIWLSSPHMGGSELKYIYEAFEQNWVAPLGPNVAGFESDLEKFLGEGMHVAALSSGTGAIHLALVMLGVGHGDEVICQSLTFAASANPIKYVGANPVFVDSEEVTWNLCPQVVEDAIKNGIARGKKPKAIIAVNLYGMPYMIDEVHEIAERYGVAVIEDAAESLGSIYKGRKCGTFGDISILSFNGNKIITTSGGGALIVKNLEFKNQAVYLSTQARDDAPHYEHTSLGYNYRMSNISAGIGRGQMEVLSQRVVARRANFEFYKNIFADWDGITVHEEPSEDYFSNHWLSTILIDQEKAGVSATDIRTVLMDKNIESRPIWKPMHMQPVFRNEKYFGGTVAEDLFKSGLCLPSGSNMTDAQRERIADALAIIKSGALPKG